MTARTLHRLTARKVEALVKPGRHANGGGLYLLIREPGENTDAKAGSKSWIFLYRWRDKATKAKTKRIELGLGSTRDVPLARARELAAAKRQQLAAGQNPKTSRATAGETSFAACAERLIASLEPSWRSPIHAQQWRATLAKEAARLSPLPVDKITTEDVLAVLEPIWHTKPTTADRLRARIEKVLNSAKTRGLIASPYENPARWRGHLDGTLSKRRRSEVAHHKALDYEEVPALLRKLQDRDDLGARALQLAILTALRTSETRGARWDEIDFATKTWTIPAERMKNNRTHRVPLSRAALAVLEPLYEARTSEFVFPGAKAGTHLARAALRKPLERMGVDGTVHGFRSSFRIWAAEKTTYPHEVCEEVLAHAVGSAVSRAYRRTDMFDARRSLMEDWGEFCTAERGKVLAFQGNSGPERLPARL